MPSAATSSSASQASAANKACSSRVVAECDDSYLHEARGFHLTHEHVYAALDSATGGPVAEGCVGGGTGMVCFNFRRACLG
jgi:L-aminopeptidase/D-esterase-like protein